MEKLFTERIGVKRRVVARILRHQLACQPGGMYLAAMTQLLRWLFGPSLDNRAATAAEIAALRQRLDSLEQELLASRRAFTALEVDMTGLSDKLSRQLKRIRQRAAGASETGEDDEEQGELTLHDFNRLRGA